MLADLYIENLFKIQQKTIMEILLPELIDPSRKKLQALLDKKTNYDPATLLEKVKDSWMTDEEILLLIKMKEFRAAIEIYIKNGNYDEAEQFCNSKPELGLMTTLLKIYFDKYRHHWDMKT
jgi:hypothetical protein